MNSVINLNKPGNISSQQAVTRVKRFFAAKKAGHAGTLDPLATGILLVCLDEATKITRFLTGLDKEYRVRLKLGESTDTYDSTGKITKTTDYHHIKEEDIQPVLKTLIGKILQTPPMYSAIKIGGQTLYKLARKGIHLERPQREITVQSIDILAFDLPYLDLNITCSKGTYIRTICHDIGEALGTGAHMVSLTRTRIGPFTLENSLTFERLGERTAAHITIDEALAHLPEQVLDEDSYRKARNGVPLLCSELLLCEPFPCPTGFTGPEVQEGEKAFPDAEKGETDNSSLNQYIRLKSPWQELFGIGKREHNRIQIARLLN
jgi:tRNA pseudouridine55 synthase